jgi:hypothetical protein
MKRRFSLMWRIVITLIMVLSLGLVMAAPVVAQVSQPTVTVDPAVVNLAAEYTIDFTTNEDLAMSSGDDIRVQFPAGTSGINAGQIVGKATINGETVTDVNVASQLVTLEVPVDINNGSVTVIFDGAAGITNPPDVGSYNLAVSTSREVDLVTSAPYIINPPPPTITAVAPPQANQGETLDVFILGTNFTDGVTVSFGSGITVVSHEVVDAQNITASISIATNATIGTKDVTVTTTAGGDTETAFEVLAAGTELVDVYSGMPSYGTYVDSEITIQDAVGDVGGTGWYLIAHAATYTEDFIVNIGDLTLSSLGGMAETTIQLVDGVGIDIQAGGDGFTLGGESSRGFAIVGDPDDTTFNIQLTNAPSGVEISHNTIDTAGNASMGISVGAAGASDLTISSNSFMAEAGDGSIWGPKMVNVNVSNNTFTGPGGPPASGYAVEFAGVTSTSTISSNTITGFAMGIAIFNGEGTSDLAISGNTISECGNGIRLGQYTPPGSVADDMTTVAVYRNTLTGNTIALRVNDGPNVIAHDFTISYNDISGSTTWGLQNEHASETVTAKYNWWGDMGGPGGEGLGNGDAVSTMVLYDPWLTKMSDTVIDNGIRSYGSDAIAVEIGWNTLSVPCTLKSEADTFGEIAGLGDFIIPVGTNGDNFIGGYWYDASVPEWKGIDSSTTVEPGKGFYVLMSAESRFPVLYYDDILGLPAYDMYTGWNLAGSMFGIDRTGDAYGVAVIGDADNEDQKLIEDALDSIQANGSVVVSPSLPGQENVWSLTVSGDGATNMLVGEAYWVFMTASGTLAGFEVTPYYFTWVAP